MIKYHTSFIVLFFMALSGCSSMHTNNQQVISNDEALYPFGDEAKVYIFMSPEYKDLKNKVEDGLITQSESDYILKLKRIPNYKSSDKSDKKIPHIFFKKKVNGCYSLGDEGNVELSNLKLASVNDKYFVSSLSEKGCFNKGDLGKHNVDFLEISDGKIQIIVSDKKLFKLSFLDWAIGLNGIQRYMYGVNVKYTNDKKVNEKKKAVITVSSLSAYKGYFNSQFIPKGYQKFKRRNPGWASVSPPTIEEENAYRILVAAEIKKTEKAKSKKLADNSQLKDGHKTAKVTKQLKKPNLYKLTNKKPSLPYSVNNFYLIDQNGGISVWQDNKNNTLNSYAELLSQFDFDLGTEINQYFGWRRYDSSKGLIYNQPIQSKVTGKLRNYCSSLKSEPYYTWLKPYKLSDGKYVSNVWRVIPDNSKGVCIIGAYTSKGCKMTKCQKYLYSKSLATSSKKIAYDLARKKQKKESLNYNEMKREADRIRANSSTANTTMKSYEEAGGLCGAISCMQQDTDFSLEW